MAREWAILFMVERAASCGTCAAIDNRGARGENRQPAGRVYLGAIGFAGIGLAIFLVLLCAAAVSSFW